MGKKTTARDYYVAEAQELSEYIQELADKRREAVVQRAAVIKEGLANGCTSTDFSAGMNIASSRVFAMVKQGEDN